MRAGASWCWLQEITLVFSSTQMPGGRTDLFWFYRRLSVGCGWQLVTKLHVCCGGFVYWGNATTGSMTGLRLYGALAFKIRPLLLVFPERWEAQMQIWVHFQHVTFPQKTFRNKVGWKKALELQLSSVLIFTSSYFKIRLMNPFLIAFFYIYRVGWCFLLLWLIGLTKLLSGNNLGRLSLTKPTGGTLQPFYPISVFPPSALQHVARLWEAAVRFM